MKRTASLFLIVAMLLAVFASAAPEDSSDDSQEVKTLSLSLTDIESRVLENNPVVRSNNNTLENMKDPDGLIGARDDIFTQAAKLDMTIGAMVGASPDGKITPEIMQLSFTANYLRAQGQQMEAPDKDDIEETGWQLAQVNYTLVTAVESMYVSCLAMERQLADLKQSAGVMDRNLEAMKLRYEFGQVSSTDLDGFVSQKESLDSGIITLENGLKTLRGEINMQLGRSYDAPLELAAPVPDLTYPDKIDRSADLQTAKNASFALKIKKRAIKDADDTDYDDKQYNTFKRDYENKVMDANAEEEIIRFTQDKLINAISEKETTYDLEQNNLTLEKKKLEGSELKFKLGTISEIDLLSARLSLSEQETKVQDASDALCAAIKSYQWFLRGIYTSSGGSSGGVSGALS